MSGQITRAWAQAFVRGAGTPCNHLIILPGLCSLNVLYFMLPLPLLAAPAFWANEQSWQRINLTSAYWELLRPPLLNQSYQPAISALWPTCTGFEVAAFFTVTTDLIC